MHLVDDIEPVLSSATVTIDFEGHDIALLDRLEEHMGMDAPEAIMELIRRSVPSINGRGFGAICDNCGLPFSSFHRPKAGIKHYCNLPDCKKEAAADRARRYRQRKATNGAERGA